MGVDGMDPRFVRAHWDDLPNFKALAEQGSFVELGTTIPPQSPVAWSTVITGLDPAGHGVYDFVHRKADDKSPFSSMAEVEEAEWTLEIGDYELPLSGGGTNPLREGDAFWSALAEKKVPVTMVRMPTDFPPLDHADHALSGMGTPDMLGSFGTFTYFTDDPSETRHSVSGGRIVTVKRNGGRVQTAIEGPPNTFRKDREPVAVDITIDIDPERPVARIMVGDQPIVLQEGDWSEWVPLSFELVPWMASASGIVRFYLKETHPTLKLYVSPINIDPMNPELPVSHPNEWAGELAESVGRFYTQGMAEETKALSAHIITRPEFVQQAGLVIEEEVELFRHVRAQHDAGFLFYYFSTVDQAGHMLWGDHEEAYTHFYRRVDDALGEAMEEMGDDTTLLVISDHGFARFDREVHLNSFLADEGYLVLYDDAQRSEFPGFQGVDWSQTTAYALGLNGLYLNLQGREATGIVEPGDEANEILAEIEEKLLALRDIESDGEQVVDRVYRPHKDFEGDNLEYAPDFIVGFAPPYRMSPETGLGAIPDVVIEDNDDEWIGDHCMNHDKVSGVLFSNKKVTAENPRLHDVPVTVLEAYGLPKGAGMVGKSFLSD